jgi:hypothetical protein
MYFNGVTIVSRAGGGVHSSVIGSDAPKNCDLRRNKKKKEKRKKKKKKKKKKKEKKKNGCTASRVFTTRLGRFVLMWY